MSLQVRKDIKADNGAEKDDWQSVHVIQRQPSGLQPVEEQQAVLADIRPAPTIADKVLAYFARLGAPPLKQGFNPADHLLIAVEALEENGVDIPGVFEESQEYRELMLDVGESMKSPQPLPKVSPAASNLTQFKLLLNRNLLTQWRDPRFSLFRFLWYVVTAVFIGTIFFKAPCTLNGAVLRIGALFFAVYTVIIPMQVAVVPLVLERAVLYRETSSGTYSPWMDGLARFVGGIPFQAVFAVTFYALYYYTVGFATSPAQTGYFILMMFFAFWTITSFGEAAALLSPNVETANGLAGLVILLSTFLMGFLIPVKLMPAGWQWAIWVNMLYYILQGLCVNELGNQYFQLNLNETVPCYSSFPYFPPLNNSTNSSLPFTSSLRQPVSLDLTIPIPPCFEKLNDLQEALRSLAPCAIANCRDATSITGLTFCLSRNCPRDFTRFMNSLIAAQDCFPPDFLQRLQAFIPCFNAATTPEEQAQCVWNYLLSDSLKSFLETFFSILKFFSSIFGSTEFLFQWIYYAIVYDVIFIPGSLILFFFGWAEINPNGGGFIANTQWWYCLFAICMFLVAWETLKLFARVYVVWVVR